MQTKCYELSQACMYFKDAEVKSTTRTAICISLLCFIIVLASIMFFRSDISLGRNFSPRLISSLKNMSRQMKTYYVSPTKQLIIVMYISPCKDEVTLETRLLPLLCEDNDVPDGAIMAIYVYVMIMHYCATMLRYFVIVVELLLEPFTCWLVSRNDKM